MIKGDTTEKGTYCFFTSTLNKKIFFPDFTGFIINFNFYGTGIAYYNYINYFIMELWRKACVYRYINFQQEIITII